MCLTHGHVARPSQVQRAAEHARLDAAWGIVQRRGGGDAPMDAGAVIPAAQAGIGAGGEVPFRPQMEAAFQTSFDDVKVHAGSAASQASAAIGADAYTYGNDVVLGAAPTPSLVAHELAHVVQQRAGAGPSGGVGSAGDSFEREADAAASVAASGGTTDLVSRYASTGGAGALQRKAVQRYESGEHAMIGSGMSYPFSPAEREMPNGAMATAGELVAFGDFYADMEQLRTSPRQETESLVGLCRFEAIWHLAEREKRAAELNAASGTTGLGSATTDPAAGQRRPEGAGPSPGHLATNAKVTWPDEIWDHQPPGCPMTLRARAQEIHAQFSPAWEFFGMSLALGAKPDMNIGAMRSTLGRRRFRGKNDALGAEGTADPAGHGGDYFDLAANNTSHFAVSNWSTYGAMHEAMCAKVATDRSAVDDALTEDGLALHFLTDQFAAGHMVDKQALMTYATGMILKMAGKPCATGAEAHEVLESSLIEALQQCFDDPEVGAKWVEGCQLAHDQGLIDRGELELMTSLPAGNYWANGGSVVGQIVDTIMSMPWRRKTDPEVPSDGHDRSWGPATEEDGSGDYHLGVGNLAALQVHEAMNHIGFLAQNDAGDTWHMQGDGHLTAETQAIAQRAVAESQQQVELGESNVAAVKQYTPSSATMIPGAFRDFFTRAPDLAASEGVHYDPTRMAALMAEVEAASKTPFPLLEGKTVAPQMGTICELIMKMMFNEAPEDPKHGTSGTGLNISMLREFLKARLPSMVAATYAASSAADLPTAALEAYVPRIGDQVLPTAANGFRWDGDTIRFQVNVTGVQPGPIKLGIQSMGRSSDSDTAETGQTLASPLGTRADFVCGTYSIDLDVPATTTEGPVASPRHYVEASYEMTYQDLVASYGSPFITVYADEGCAMIIGRSGNRTEGITNPAPTTPLPQVTGDDATPLDYVRATGIVGNAFEWEGATVRFQATHGAPPSMPASTSVRLWYRTFNCDAQYDYSETGSEVAGTRNDDPEHGSIRSVDAVRVGGVTADILLTPDDNPNDTYIVVYADAAGNQALGRSEVQGTNHGVGGGVPATAATGFTWAGATLSFAVQPPTTTAVWIKFYNKDWDYDHGTDGVSLGADNNTDPEVGAIRRIAVTAGRASTTASDGADNPGDTYAIAYADAVCTVPLGRSDVQP